MEPFNSPDVESVFGEYPQRLKSRLLALRQLIFDTASETEGVGPLEETLKWGQPSYLTPKTKSGTTIRVDQIKSNPDQYGMFVHCQTSLLPTYRELYSGVLASTATEASCLASMKIHQKMCFATASSWH